MIGKRSFAILLIATVLCGLALAPAQANWLSTLGEIAASSGKVAGKTGRLAGEVSVGLERAATAIAKLPAEMKAGAIAAEALDGGAWRLRNAAGETITATSAESVRGALAGLAGDTKSLTFYVGEETAFAARGPLAALPSEAKLRIAVDDASYPLLRQGSGETTALFAELSPGVILALKDRSLFGEALWQLQRPLGKSGVRVLSLDAGGPKTLSTLGKRSAEGMPVAEIVDPAALAAALPSLRGQTVIVTGAVEGETIRFAGISGAEGSIPTAELMQAAERSDVNILLLDAGSAKQPGGTTWLWQERGIAHLDAAMAKTTLGDFISALSRGQGRLAVDADWGVAGHFRLSAKPAATDAPAASGEAAAKSFGESTLDVAVDLAAKISENVVPRTTSASLNSRNTQWDIDNRLIPGIPAWLQYWYLFSWVAGLIGYFHLKRWWRWLRRRAVGAEAPTGWPAKIGEGVIYWLAFTPLLGWPALMVVLIHAIFDPFAAVVRGVGGLFRRTKAGA
jgi:hypothetical protein